MPPPVHRVMIILLNRNPATFTATLGAIALYAVYGSARDRALRSVPLPLQLKVTGDGSVGVEIGEWGGRKGK